MIIHIRLPRSEELLAREDLYLCKDKEAYMHFSKIRISNDNPHSAELSLLERICTEYVRLVDQRETNDTDFLPLGLRAGLTICLLPVEEQDTFWKEMEEAIDAFCLKYINPEAVKSSLVIVLPGSQFGHIDDKSDELYAYLDRDEDGSTKIGFLSTYNFGGPQGPDMVLLREVS